MFWVVLVSLGVFGFLFLVTKVKPSSSIKGAGRFLEGAEVREEEEREEDEEEEGV